MKTIFNYFKKRREQKLRMWCVEQAAKFETTLGSANPSILAKDIYNWVTY